MKIYNLLLMTSLLLIMGSCGNDTKNADDLFSVEIKDAKNAYKETDVLQVSVKNKKNKTLDKVSWSLDSDPIPEASGNSTSISLNNRKLGTKTVTATITVDDQTYDVSTEVILLSSIKPKLYTYKIVETYPHDITAYTQGLEFENDTLYESTGQKKESTLRKINYTTGEVYKSVPLADQYFGEGITILNNKIYQLTWQSKTGFIYNLNTMEKKGSFVYGKSNEGWGLCNDGSTIFKSDGTEKIWTLNPETLGEDGHIEIYTNTSRIKSVNELEWVDGKIYANIYQKDAIAIVNPENGAVEGVINLSGLKDKVTQHDKLDVLNGIAYKGEENILYVTGKNWDKLFKIEIIGN